MIVIPSKGHNQGISFDAFFVLCCIIAFFNIATIGSPLGIIITIPQYFLVLKYLFDGNIKSATLLHFAFIMLSVSSQGVYGMFDDQNFSMYNYGTLKLIGPVRACYVINIILVALISASRLKINKHTLYFKLFKVMLYLAITGFLIGVGGFIVDPYYGMEGMVDNCIYMFVLLSCMYILLHMIDQETVKAAYYVGLIAIMVGPIVSALGFLVLHITSSYGMYDIIVNVDVVYFSALLIFGLLYVHQKKLLIISFGAYLYVAIAAIGGKSIFGIAFCFLTLFFLLIFDKDTKRDNPKMSHFLRPVLFLVMLIVPVLISSLGDSFAAYKITSALSIFSGNLSEVSRSPFIRIASLINIFHEGFQNPFFLLFGHGYGGYFEDHFNYFEGLQLEKGAWHGEDLVTGRYHSGHDTIVVVPLLNGLVGLFVLVKISWQYIKRIKYNYFNAVAFLWILLVFYSNTILAFMGTFLLFAAEYNLEKDEAKRHNSILLGKNNK